MRPVMEWGYYPGCTLTQSASAYDRQVRALMERIGRPVAEIADWNCCGATSASKHDAFLATALPARNLGLAESQGFSRILVPCSGCYSREKAAQYRMFSEPDTAESVNARLSHKVTKKIHVVSILEALDEALSDGSLNAAATKKLTGMKAAPYYGCLTRLADKAPFFDDNENPQVMERILSAMGIESVDFSAKTRCCGASAAVNDRDNAISLMSIIMAQAVERGANAIVVSCPMCHLNMDACQDEVGLLSGIQRRLPVYYITELLGLSAGLDPEILGLTEHFVSGLPLLSELGLP